MKQSVRIFILFATYFLCSPAIAKGKISHLSPRKLMFYFSSDFHVTNSKADQVTDAVYDHKFTNPYTLNVGMGVTLFSHIYIGARYEYWIGQRQLTLNGVGQTDTLKVQNLGGEIGWVTGNPRVFWILMASAYYPLEQSVEVRRGTTQIYSTLPTRLGYSGRLNLGIKLNNTFAILLEGGYRMADLGQPQSNSQNYLNNGEFNLSGPFGGLGFSILLW